MNAYLNLSTYYLNQDCNPLNQITENMTFQQVIDFTDRVKVQELNYASRVEMAITLQHMARETERTLMGFRKIFKIFNAIGNGFSGKGFQTSISKARQLADSLFVSAKSIQATNLSQSIDRVESVIITYIKGETKTRDIIPTKKEVLGASHFNQVHEHQELSTLVVKKSKYSLEEEYKIGVKLNHSHFVKVHNLYMKKLLDGKSKNKLLMDKVEGQTLGAYNYKNQRISNETVQRLLEQAKHCCLYLSNQDIIWKDLNSGNIFIVPNKNEPHCDDLMLIDFEAWKTVENPKTCTYHLLMGAIQLVGGIISTSSLGYDLKKQAQIILPQEFFGRQILFSEAFLIEPLYLFCPSGEQTKILKKIETLNDVECQNFLSDYFNQVINIFNLM